MNGRKHSYQSNRPHYANPELFDVVHAVVAGAVKGFNNDHPGCLVKNHGSLVKRICNQLTTTDVEQRLRTALTPLENADDNT